MPLVSQVMGLMCVCERSSEVFSGEVFDIEA